MSLINHGHDTWCAVQGVQRSMQLATDRSEPVPGGGGGCCNLVETRFKRIVQMTVVFYYCRGVLIIYMWRGVSQGVCPLGRFCRTLWIGHIYNIQYFVTLPLDQSKSIWSSASWLTIYYLLKNPVGKIRSTQCLLDNENNLTWIPKEKYACNHHS
jgi:hypothetical protein